MKAEIITIGDELLIGQVVNTNAAWMSRELNATGIVVERVTTIGDEMSAILAAFRKAWKAYDLVIVTGGLGPTHDDISKAAVARFFHQTLTLHKPTLRAVKERFTALGYVKMPDINIGQAMVPEGFTALRNERGTAPGLLFHESGKTFVILPGVPVEMEYVMTNGVLPFLRKTCKAQLEVIRHRTILTSGIGESVLAGRIGDPKSFLGSGTTLAFLPRAGGVRVRISARGKSERVVEAEIRRVEDIVREKAEQYIYGTDNETLEATIVKRLTELQKTLATAESCTGGLIAARLTEVPGASLAYRGSIIAYSDAVKMSQLGVPQSVLASEGAVSERTVIAMAEGALAALGTDYAIAVTGIAGPDGGTEEKPVGTIWLALAQRGVKTVAKKIQLDFGRTLNRERAAMAAMEMLRRRLV